MAPSKYEDDWSDSDSDDGDAGRDGVETAVQLGVPNGALEVADARDAAVSRIGGHPVRYVPSPCVDVVQDVDCRNAFFVVLPCVRSMRGYNRDLDGTPTHV